MYNFSSMHGFKFGSPFEKGGDSRLKFSKRFLARDSCSITNIPVRFIKKSKNPANTFQISPYKTLRCLFSCNITLSLDSFTLFLLYKKGSLGCKLINSII